MLTLICIVQLLKSYLGSWKPPLFRKTNAVDERPSVCTWNQIQMPPRDPLLQIPRNCEVLACIFQKAFVHVGSRDFPLFYSFIATTSYPLLSRGALSPQAGACNLGFSHGAGLSEHLCYVNAGHKWLCIRSWFTNRMCWCLQQPKWNTVENVSTFEETLR